MNPPSQSPQGPPRPTTLAWSLLRETIREGDTVIDATAGNGHDSVFLAGCTGPGGRVLSFDVQKCAIESSRRRVAAAGCASWVEFHHCSHARLRDFVEPDSVSAVMFNLGYLPGEDHDLTTTSEETLRGLVATGFILKTGGSITVICYPGHATGVQEAAAVEKWLTEKSEVGWRIAKYSILGTLRPSPFLLLARKGG